MPIISHASHISQARLTRVSAHKFVCLTDVPTPYRVHLFEAMARAFENRGVKFEVYFMARTVPLRSWELTPSDWRFVHHFGAGLHLTKGATTIHLNPSVVFRILRDAPRWLLVGGAWHLPTSVALLGARSLLRTGTTLLWAEANHASMSVRAGSLHRLRQLIANKADAFAVPGRIAANTLRNDWGLKEKPILPLPNLIDEELFGGRVSELRRDRAVLRKKIGASTTDFVMLWPARLHEETKGLLNFLRPVEGILNSRVKILIAGEGPDRALLEAWLASSSISGVTLLGWQPEERMLELYALADLFLLPSLRDPNPLSVIEALWAGLPVLISDRCGNYPEAVEEGVNGWVVDPAAETQIQGALEKVLRLTPDELASAGAASARIARQRFSTKANVERFVDSVVKVA
jgi:glycosyltransferase involved in cell wall biosynthesis